LTHYKTKIYRLSLREIVLSRRELKKIIFWMRTKVLLYFTFGTIITVRTLCSRVVKCCQNFINILQEFNFSFVKTYRQTFTPIVYLRLKLWIFGHYYIDCLKFKIFIQSNVVSSQPEYFFRQIYRCYLFTYVFFFYWNQNKWLQIIQFNKLGTYCYT